MEPRPRPQGYTGLLARVRALPPIVLIVLLLVMLGVGIVIGQKTLTRTGIVTREVTASLEITPGDGHPVVFPRDAASGTVDYMVKNTGVAPCSVEVTKGSCENLEVDALPPTFDLPPGASQPVEVTLSFTNADSTAGTYELVFTTTQ